MEIIRYVYDYERVGEPINESLQTHSNKATEMVVYTGEYKTEKKPIATFIATSQEHYGMSVCHPKDKFVKKTGKVLARQDIYVPESDKAIYKISHRNYVITEREMYIVEMYDDFINNLDKYFKE